MQKKLRLAILFITHEFKVLKTLKQENKELRTYYRDRMRQLGGFRRFKNSFKIMPGRWKTRRRINGD